MPKVFGMCTTIKITLIAILIGSIGPSMASQNEHAVLLTGRLTDSTSVPPRPLRGPVDLRLSLFAAAQHEQPVRHQEFTDITLERGVFTVPMRFPAEAWRRPADLYIEVALRAAGRKYAPYQTIPPRQALAQPQGSRTYLALSQPLEWRGTGSAHRSVSLSLARLPEREL